MKKVSLFTVVALLILSVNVYAGEISYKEANMEIFSVRFLHPENWKLEVTANHCIYTDPSNENRQLIFLEAYEFNGTLEQYLEDYKENLMDKAKDKIISVDNTEIAGMGAYYIRLESGGKDLGHIIFIRDKMSYALALKTEKGQYSKYEPVLMKAKESLKFNKTK